MVPTQSHHFSCNPTGSVLLLDDTIDQEYGGTVKRQQLGYGQRYRQEIAWQAFQTLNTCQCGHHGFGNCLTPEAVQAALRSLCPPGYQVPNADAVMADDPAAGAMQGAAADDDPNYSCDPSISRTIISAIDGHSLRQILQLLSPQDLWRLTRMPKTFGIAALDTLRRHEQVCFYSKNPYTQSTLGFGITRNWHHDSNNLKTLSTQADYISVEAFSAGVGKSAWNHPFDAFLPLYLNPTHGTRALQLLPSYLRGMQQRTCSTGPLATNTPMEPRALLTVLAQLLNSLVVQLVDLKPSSSTSTTRAPTGYGYEAPAAGVSRQLSDAALQTFCHLHHLLLAAAVQPGSQLIQTASQHVSAFVNQEGERHKSKCPDLGVLLVEFLLVPKDVVSWEKMVPALMRELLARQVMWVIRKVGKQFGKVYQENTNSHGNTRDDTQRLQQHFEASGTSFRVVMLQSWFANALPGLSDPAAPTQSLLLSSLRTTCCLGCRPPRCSPHLTSRQRLCCSVQAGGM